MDLVECVTIVRCLLGTVIVLSLLLTVVVVAAIQVALFSPKELPNGNAALVHRDSSAAFEDALVVRTNCGEYIGTIEDGAFVFKKHFPSFQKRKINNNTTSLEEEEWRSPFPGRVLL
ncbi:uncharacterized protein CEXT_504201 [Caerostris extrusa]|uniref:Uncharacterized protein n=1 Tax=Caerostris extrusa TaxID=172846 RepID=A0AAV4NZ07_CAEEX|nr:uncharacterized protein CEXT_504201 [Caerostris extrusa]